MSEITIDLAREAMASAGYSFLSLEQVGEGSNHYIFRAILADGSNAICKFARTRSTEEGITPPNTDTLFGGSLSLERERYLFSMVREKTGIPTPRVYGLHSSKYGDFLMVESLPGISYGQYLRDSGYSARAYLDSLRQLGRDFAAIQQIRFPFFGNIMQHAKIEPAGLSNFADRWAGILHMRIDCCAKKGALQPDEEHTVRTAFTETLESMRCKLEADVSIPVLNFTDMHPENFFVDGAGAPSGYFDLESAQAAPAALEFYGFRFFLFNLFKGDWSARAERAFFEGYAENDGSYAPSNPFDHELIDYLAACRLLELTNSYWGYIDGIRDRWGAQMKTLLFEYLQTGDVNYSAVGDIWRQRDKHPFYPLRD